MPITLQIDYEAGLVEAHYIGQVTFREMRDATEQVFSNPAAGPNLRLLGIFSDLKTSASNQDFSQYRAWRKKLPRFLKTAFVASTDFEYGIARMFMSVSDGVGAIDVNVFRSVKEARAWLGLPES